MLYNQRRQVRYYTSKPSRNCSLASPQSVRLYVAYIDVANFFSQFNTIQEIFLSNTDKMPNKKSKKNLNKNGIRPMQFMFNF